MQYWKDLHVAVVFMATILWLPISPVSALQVGDQAPAFSLPATTAETISLSDYFGKKNLVVFFYIAAFGQA